MAEPTDIPEVPRAVRVRKRRFAFQWVWLLPVVAALVGGFLAVRAILADGPTVTIRFTTAEGIEAGKTRVKYKDVDIGVVKNISLDENRAGIIVRADLSKAAEDLVVQDTRFWVVRARIAGGTVSGIGTLLSGSYIGMDPGKSTESRRDFEGLETPPVITTGLQGKQIVLLADDLGSLDVGSPVYFRRLEAGRVVAYELDKEGKRVLVRIFVNSPYDRYVTPSTRFWHASGIDVSLDANGLKINTESLTSIAVGGLAFQTPDSAPAQPAVAENATFPLFADRVQAMKSPVTITERYLLVFRESVRGLGIGAPVDFRGLVVGEVRAIEAAYDRVKKELGMVVEIDFYPERLFRNRQRTVTPAPDGTPSLARLVERGLRAQMRSANLLTGQQYIALDFVPGAKKAAMDVRKSPPEIPTVAGSAQELQATIASISKKLERVQFEEISGDVRKTLKTTTAVLERVDREVAPQVRDTMIEARQAMVEAREALVQARKALSSVERTLANAEPLPSEASDALREIGRAAQSFRVLADYLERHPEAVIRGKKEDKR
ncbi:MAG: mammalian cell entry protein [Betaproteobacteria bacterium]|nr:mammalian cell entry protein [Betaproteobacteria bacterium]